MIVLVRRARARERNGIPQNPGFHAFSSLQTSPSQGDRECSSLRIQFVIIPPFHPYADRRVRTSGNADPDALRPGHEVFVLGFPREAWEPFITSLRLLHRQ